MLTHPVRRVITELDLTLVIDMLSGHAVAHNDKRKSGRSFCDCHVSIFFCSRAEQQTGTHNKTYCVIRPNPDDDTALFS